MRKKKKKMLFIFAIFLVVLLLRSIGFVGFKSFQRQILKTRFVHQECILFLPNTERR
jgi:hypothetical protein